jgi:hypothetical protein
MNLKSISDQVSNLDNKQKSAILELIDLKTNQDMREVISEIRLLKSDMDTKFSAIDTKITTLQWAIYLIGLIISISALFAKFN